MIFQKVTLFSLLCPLVAVVSAGLAIYYRKDVTGLGTAFMLIALVVALVLLALDRVAVRYVPAGRLSIGEGLLLVGAVVSFLYVNRTTTLDLSANPSPYFIVLWTNGPAPATPWQRTFPFSKTLTVPTARTVQLDYAEFDQIDVKTPTRWGDGSSSRGISITDPRFQSAYFYAPIEHSFTDEQMTKLVQEAVREQSR